MKSPNHHHDESQKHFYAYYERESLSSTTIARFENVLRTVSRLHSDARGGEKIPCDVADVGCGAGTNSLIWARHGHLVHALDINKALVELGIQRAQETGFDIDFRVGSATKLPWEDESMDICLIPELLEHVEDWDSCLREASRILKPGGVLYLSTTNKLCPKQQEYNLPIYSWYPGFLKHFCERLAMTTLPGIANHAAFPAVHWFSFYQLRDYLAKKGLHSMDRFDAMDLSVKSQREKRIVASIKSIPLLRFLAHVATPATLVFAINTKGQSEKH